jgi:hypothetical protein
MGSELRNRTNERSNLWILEILLMGVILTVTTCVQHQSPVASVSANRTFGEP